MPLDWTYENILIHRGKTFHLWSASHPEGYTAYQVTHQPADSKIDYIKPIGDGHYTSLDVLMKRCFSADSM